MTSVADRIIERQNEQWRIHHMGCLERESGRLHEAADDIAHRIRCIAGLPAFETTAEEALDKAILRLTDALMAAKVARAELKKKRRPRLEKVA